MARSASTASPRVTRPISSLFLGLRTSTTSVPCELANSPLMKCLVMVCMAALLVGFRAVRAVEVLADGVQIEAVVVEGIYLPVQVQFPIGIALARLSQVIDGRDPLRSEYGAVQLGFLAGDC